MTHNASDSKPPPPYDARNMSETKKEPAAGEPRYVYYRVYCPDGAIPSKTAFNPRDPYVGRILARSVPPPHNAATLKRCFVNAENIGDPDGSRTRLYRNPEAAQPLSVTDKVVIIGSGATDGATPESAFAVVFQDDLNEEERVAITRIDQSCSQEEPKYLYYRLFTWTGEDRSKVSFNSTEPAVGRVEKILISPPHGLETIKRSIAKVECKPIYRYSDVYENLLAQEALSDRAYLALMEGTTIGLTEEDLMVLVQPERRAGLYNRPVKLVVELNIFFPMGSLAYTDGVLADNRYTCVQVINATPTTGAHYDTAYLYASNASFIALIETITLQKLDQVKFLDE
ncbi:hypothetical protein C8R45DRAFT_1183988 [Mycena sanguinolenta]|nr:hypothetical protein C8R45DRAFT_1183988 [Mycena sanguinolenta]